MITEITARELNADQFSDEKVREIQDAVGNGMAINALSGGVDSSVVTMLGHRALGKQLMTVFAENGLMREGEPEEVAVLFGRLGVTVKIVDAREEFFAAIKGIMGPEAKREAITQAPLGTPHGASIETCLDGL
jgi:GMP synthase (glutamine-hydrolysing)